MKKDSVLASTAESPEKLGTNQIESFFLHSPNPDASIEEETLAVVQELYVAEKFRQLGVSNFNVEEFKQLYDVACSVFTWLYLTNCFPRKL